MAVDLLGRGHSVKVGPLLLRDQSDDKDEFADQADIIVNDVVLEVKSRSLSFTSPEDYPYPTAFVCAVKRWDKRSLSVKPLPFATVLVSEKTGVFLVVPTSTSGNWTSEDIFDRKRRYPTDTYVVAKELLQPWEWLIAELEKAD